MDAIMYYSNNCENCKKILPAISKNKNTLHFLCVDTRIKKPNGSTYLRMKDGQEVLLPPTITKVHALLLLNRGNRVLFGPEIMNFLAPPQAVTRPVEDPVSFSMGSVLGGISSDSYSFLDQTNKELALEGTGGMRQQHHYVGVNTEDHIETPTDSYTSNKIDDYSIEALQKQRDQDSAPSKRTMF